MNRNITECFSAVANAADQGKVFHKYILGVYDLYDRLTTEFPEILFESCASGGSRFDPGMSILCTTNFGQVMIQTQWNV